MGRPKLRMQDTYGCFSVSAMAAPFAGAPVPIGQGGVAGLGTTATTGPALVVAIFGVNQGVEISRSSSKAAVISGHLSVAIPPP